MMSTFMMSQLRVFGELKVDFQLHFTYPVYTLTVTPKPRLHHLIPNQSLLLLFLLILFSTENNRNISTKQWLKRAKLSISNNLQTAAHRGHTKL